jgi:DNA-binding MarR family transcriptional regulator
MGFAHLPQNVLHQKSRFEVMRHLLAEAPEAITVAELRHRLADDCNGGLPAHLARLKQVGFVTIEPVQIGSEHHKLVRVTEKGREQFISIKQSMDAALAGMHGRDDVMMEAA